MIRRIFLSFVLCLFAGVASAEVFTLSTGSLLQGSPASYANDVSSVDLAGNNSRGWANTFATGPNSLGIRVVGVALLSQYNVEPNGVVSNVKIGGAQMAAVFTLEGVVTGVDSADYTSGTVGIFQAGSNPSDFNPLDPGTWGVDLNSLDNAIAYFTLQTPKDVEQALDVNDPAAVLDASQVNKMFSIPNGVGFILLFEETNRASQAGINFLNVAGGDPDGFMSVTRNSTNTGDNANIDQYQLDWFNAIAAAVGGYGDLGGLGTAWATGIGPGGLTGTNYNPGGVGADAGDLFASLDTEPVTGNSYVNGIRPGYGTADDPPEPPEPPVINEVPEPASMMLWLGVAGIAATGARRMRRNKQLT
jgi:hypothetical protein